MSTNPFTLSFGKKPLQYISRLTETNQILESFCAEIPSNQIYMITGVRGSGKTVMMTNIASELRKREDWIVVELNPTRDLLQSLAAFPNYTRCSLMQNLTFLLLVWEYPLKTLLRSRISKTLWNSC